MIATVWFLVVLSVFPDHVHLDRNPVELATQKQCSTEGGMLMINRWSNLQIYCIEADDEMDLITIMNGAFNLGGDHV